MINQVPIVRYTAFVSEIFFSDFRKKTFSAESFSMPVPSFFLFYLALIYPVIGLIRLRAMRVPTR
jgi:hypothetical protein